MYIGSTEMWRHMDRLEVFRTPEDYKKDWRYALVIGGLPQFRGNHVILDLYQDLQGLREGYSTWSKASGGKDNIIAIEMPENKNYQTTQYYEVKVLDNILQNE